MQAKPWISASTLGWDCSFSKLSISRSLSSSFFVGGVVIVGGVIAASPDEGEPILRPCGGAPEEGDDGSQPAEKDQYTRVVATKTGCRAALLGYGDRDSVQRWGR